MCKKILRFICALAIVLSLVLVTSATAWAKDTAQLDYGDIAARVPKENATLDILQRRLPIVLKLRDDMAQASDFSRSASAAIGSISAGFNAIVNDNTGAYDKDQKQWASMMIGSLAISQASMSSMGSGDAFDSIDMSIAQLKITIPQMEAQLINTAQQLYMGYHKLQDGKAIALAGRALLEEQVGLAQTQLKAGLGTELAVKQAQLALAELDTNLKLMDSQGEQMFSQLKLIVGWPQEQIIKLGGIPKPNREFLPKIKLTDDTKTAQTNSYSIQLKKAELRFTSGDDNKKLVELEIAAKLEQISQALATQYYKISDANDTLLLEEQKLAVAEEKVKQTRLQHQLGLLAELALNAEETSYNNQKDAVESAMNSLFWEIENYKSIVAGLN